MALQEGPAAKRAKTGDAQEEPQADAERANPWRASCADVVSFRLLEGVTETELNSEIASGGQEFDAEFFHQHFGDDEQINGYKGLVVNVWFSARTYHVWVDITYKSRKMGCDQLMKVFIEHFPAGVQRSQAEFVSAVVSSATALAGVSPHGTTRETLRPAGQQPVLIQHFTLAKAPKEVQDLHARFEPLLLFFIDGASLIEKGDEKWDVLMALQGKETGPPALLGLSTVYNFWSYPDTCRLRLSQILVLPPYRDLGLGKAMLTVTYQLARECNCVDLTLEDPTPNLQRVREKVEVEMLTTSPWVMQQVNACVTAVTSGRQEWPQQPLPPARPPQAMTSDGGSAAVNAFLVGGSAAAQQQQPAGGDQPQQQSGEGGQAAGSSSPGSNANNGKAVAASVGAGRGAGARRVVEGPLACVTPSTAFISAITQEFKIYSKEARLVWEALLFLAPGLWEHTAGRAALTALVRGRLEAASFAHTGAEAERKQMVPLDKSSRKQQDNFIMMRAVAPPAGSAGTGADAGGAAVATGRLSVTTMSVEEKEEKLGEMCEERWQQLKTLKSLLARRSATA